jgi:hypothetical protein
MKRNTLLHILWTVLFLILAVYSPFNASAEAVTPESLQDVIADIARSAKERDFSNLRKYGTSGVQLYWSVCNSEGRVEFSLDEIMHELTQDSKSSDIGVTTSPSGGSIETTGWPQENAFLYFQFKRIAGRWKWLGVCEAPKRPFDFDPNL